MNQSTTQLPTSSENAIRMDKSLCSIDSFFDNDERDPKESKTLWSKPNAELIQTLLPQKGQGAPLEKKGKKTGFWISRYYVIIGNYLAYKYVRLAKLNTNNLEILFSQDCESHGVG